MQENILHERITQAFSLTLDLFKSFEDSVLDLRLDELPSNSIRNQVWCIIGARESYEKAIANTKWMGFSSSLKNSDDIMKVNEILFRTQESIKRTLREDKLSTDQINFAFDLLEHEIQHHGQLIRFVYGNKLSFPSSWNKRYTV